MFSFLLLFCQVAFDHGKPGKSGKIYPTITDAFSFVTFVS